MKRGKGLLCHHQWGLLGAGGWDEIQGLPRAEGSAEGRTLPLETGQLAT